MKFRTFALAALLSTSAMAQVSADQAAHEKALDASVSSADQMGWLKSMTSAPNHVGSAHNKANAEFILAQFKAWGWDAKLETFEVLYPTPISTTLELVAPVPVKLGGQEPTIPEDSTSGNLKDALPPYVAFQGDGDVTAEVIYANYGLPEDYAALARRGISVKGKIVLARYGGGWRGLKPKLAQEQGAAGCLIYSDPANDGYATAATYPDGGARPPAGVQRGSVADMTTYPGDPGTPGTGSVKGAKRIDRRQAVTIMKIPTLPISYADASKIFAQLGGPIVPESFRGNLPITYRTGGDGKVKLHLAVNSEWSLKTLYDVVATMKGRDRPYEWVVRGNHHDGWVFGAADPLSGDVAMLSEAKALGELAKTGWRPSRTIVYISWDGEEPMLLGSTEWAETHEAELKAKAIVYINTDGNGRGFLTAEGSHQYQHFINQVAADVKDPQTGASVAERLRAKLRADAFDGGKVDAEALKAAEAGGDLPLGPLGSGSDFSAFLQHVGVPSLNLGFGGEAESAGSYHSIYDSYDHFVRFDDPGLAYGAALSKLVGRVVLRIADADTPPLRFGDLAATVRTGYPFEGDVEIRLNPRELTVLALFLRIPAWVAKPVIEVNGLAHSFEVVEGYVRISRRWKAGDTVTLRFPLAVRLVTRAGSYVSAMRGPLSYAAELPGSVATFNLGVDVAQWRPVLQVKDNVPAASFEGAGTAAQVRLQPAFLLGRTTGTSRVTWFSVRP